MLAGMPGSLASVTGGLMQASNVWAGFLYFLLVAINYSGCQQWVFMYRIVDTTALPTLTKLSMRFKYGQIRDNKPNF